MDTQQVELVGTALFEAELIRHGFEVSKPRRDRGIDLIIYTDQPAEPFHAVPIQLKVSTKNSLSLERKYEHFNGMVLGYVWHIHTQPHFFLMTYQEAAVIIGEKALSTPSWKKDGYYAEAPVTKKHLALLTPFENRWEWLRNHLAGSVIRPDAAETAAQRREEDS